MKNALILAATAFVAHHALADPAKDEAMTKLASQSGCLTCHHVAPGRTTFGNLLAVAWPARPQRQPAELASDCRRRQSAPHTV
jgi:hypothetical protein